MIKNTQFMKKFKPEATSAQDSLQGIIHALLSATGKTQAEVEKFMEDTGATKGRFYKAMMKAFEEGKFNYATALMKLALYEGRWKAMIGTPAGQTLIKAWKEKLDPIYDPTERNSYSIPILFPRTGTESYQHTHQWMREMVHMKWAMIEGSFVVEGTTVYILKVADIPY